MSEDRIERLEARVIALEAMVRELAAGQRGSGTAGQESAGPQDRRAVGPSQAVPAPPATPHRPAPPRPRAAALLSSEQFIGQRVLLAVGVTALILAAGYLLRLSFDRGWISPLMRCVGGACAGGIVGAVGWRLHARYRTYGAALIGCGAAIIYLSVWA
ncbi:MAG TPA: DUF2339 domain-containing protein, partial [Gemmatimonadales bacterium]|nr:DUF2339 domain-containing protein [Gemmatimonadales bacterium]